MPRVWSRLDKRGAEYPAGHDVGHLYHGKPELAGFCKKLEPTSGFNPGTGHTSKCRHRQ